MIDWSARIDDLMHLLNIQYAVSDRLAVEVLLSALTECPRTCASWMIIETPYYNLDGENGWFSLGRAWRPYQMRYKSGPNEAAFYDWLDRDNKPHLFIDPDYEKYLCPIGFSITGPIIRLRSLRIRSRPPRSAHPLRHLDWRDRQRDQDELKACVASIIEDHVGARPDDPPKFIQPPNFLFYAELLQRLSPWFIDWRVLLIALAGITIRHAYLHGLTATGPQQDALLARVISDSIPPWIANALHLLLKQGSASIRELTEQMGFSKEGDKASRELRRLRKGGIIDCGNARRWFLIGEFRDGVELALDGRAFGALAACA